MDIGGCNNICYSGRVHPENMQEKAKMWGKQTIMIPAPAAPSAIEVDGGKVLKLTQLPGGTGQSSWVWNYARPVPGLLDGFTADQVTPMDIEYIYCTKCYSPSDYRRGFKQYSTKGASVTSIKNHLKNVHNIVGSAKEAQEGNVA